MNGTINHYDLLIEEGNDPVYDPVPLKEYMDKWDGQAFIDELKLTGDECVLEIGVGTGRLAIKVCGRCKSFAGIDVSPKTVDRAKENLVEYKNVELICADFIEYEFNDQSFDVVYSSLTFMHIKNKQAAINKIARALKTRGRFVLSIDNNPSKVLDINNRKIHIYPDTSDEINKLIKLAKLKIVKQFYTEFATIFVAEK